MTTKLHAFKEAATDTFLGSLINVPLNFIMVSIAFHYEWTAAVTTVVMTTVFTCIALIRKMSIRMHFAKRHQENEQSALKVPK